MTLPSAGEGRENDHDYRSRFIHSLLHHASGSEQASDCSAVIPKVIVQYWHDLSAIPLDVRACIASWETLRTEGFEHHLFGDEQARAFISNHFTSVEVNAFERCYHPAMRCDYFRLCYLFQRGGAYVDADEVYRRDFRTLWRNNRLKLQPLCYDLAVEAMVPPADFWDIAASTANRIFYVNNNPLIGPAGHPLIQTAIDRATRMLLESEGQPPIQETTGPGNISASLVRHATLLADAKIDWDFEIMRCWEDISECRWHLSYRKDERNWRIAEQMKRRAAASAPPHTD